MFAIMKFTFQEALSKKVLVISLLLAVVFLCLYGIGVHYVAKDTPDYSPMMSDLMFTQLLTLGLYFGGFIVSFLAIFSSAGAVSAEIESGTIQAIITKPLKRRDYMLGRFWGLGFFLAAYAILFCTAILLIVHMKTGLVMENFWLAIGLFTLQPIVLLAVALLGSVMFPTIANGVVMFMLYMIAIIGGMVEQIGYMVSNLNLQQAGIVSSLIMPTDSLYRKIVLVLINPADYPLRSIQQMGPFGSLSEPSLWMMIYVLGYILFFAGLAIYIFGHKDIV